jgi:hypothetical protein
MRRYRMGVAVSGSIATLALVVVAVAATGAMSSSSSRAVYSFSNRGMPLALQAGAPSALSTHGAAALAQMRVRSARLLARRGSVAFFRLERPSGDCFSIGQIRGGILTPGRTACPQGAFPSAAVPLLALPTVEIQKPKDTTAGIPYFDDPSSARQHASLLSLAGFAVDGIASVEFVRSGVQVASASVSRNVFVLDVAGSPIGDDAKIVARGSQGDVVFELPL